MRYIYALVLIFLLSSCQSESEKLKEQEMHDAKVVKQAREDLLAELAMEKRASKSFNNFGVNVDSGKITIDTNKTKDFFENLSNKLEKKMQDIAMDLDNGSLVDINAGIDIGENHISIDINKTKNSLEAWGKKIEAYAEEFRELVDTLKTEEN